MAALVIALLIILFVVIPNLPGKYDDFARCLADSGTKMYGSYLCPHCNEQKEMFGNSWRLMDYVECSGPGGQGQSETCAREGIRLYPTWEFPEGSRESGTFSFQELSDKTGCPLN